MTTKRCLVTGGCGFIGQNLVNAFVEAGYEVTVLDLKCTPFRDDVTYVEESICNKSAVIDLCEGMDTIVHNASIVHTKQSLEKLVWDVNHQGTLNIIEACRVHKIPKLIFMSSASAVYEGKDIENGDESLPYSRISQAAYADSKIQAEKDVIAFSGNGTTACCAIRPHVVFGPNDNRLIPALVEKAQAGLLKRAIGNRDTWSDFTYISNLVDAVVAADRKLAVGSPVDGQVYFITNGEPMAFFDFAEQFLMEMGQPAITGKVPYWLAYAAATVAETWDKLKGSTVKEGGLTRFAVKYMVTHHYYSIDKAKRELDWAPDVSLAEGIRLTADALKAEGVTL